MEPGSGSPTILPPGHEGRSELPPVSCAGGAGGQAGSRRSSRAPSPRVATSRAQSPANGSEDEDAPGANSDSPLKSSRGVEEHRADPALRDALERLDGARKQVPSMEAFALENYLGHRRSAPRIEDPTAGAGGSGRSSPSAKPSFSMDMLMAAALGLTRSNTTVGPVGDAGSRATSPGSTSMSTSLGAFSSGSGSSGTSRSRGGRGRPPRGPSAAVAPLEEPKPRRPGRQRAHSARGGRSEVDAMLGSAPLTHR